MSRIQPHTGDILHMHGLRWLVFCVRAQEVINQVNDTSMELLRAHFETLGRAGELETFHEFAQQNTGQTDPEPSVATLIKMHDALLSSTDVLGDVQTFYPLTADEQQQLTMAVNYVMGATDFSSAQSGLFMWMHSMSIFAHSVRICDPPLSAPPLLPPHACDPHLAGVAPLVTPGRAPRHGRGSGAPRAAAPSCRAAASRAHSGA